MSLLPRLLRSGQRAKVCPHFTLIYPTTYQDLTPRRHKLKHERKHFCPLPACPWRPTKGFRTINDLARHTLAKHNLDLGVGSGKLYRCAAEKCTKLGRNAKRLDNFMQHVRSRHKDWVVRELVERYDVCCCVLGVWLM